MDDVTSLGALALEQMVLRKEISVREMISVFLQRIEAVNPTLNAITDLQAERAMDRAADLDYRHRGSNLAGSLCGVPLTAKSSIAVKGFLQECGSPLRQGVRAKHHAWVMDKLLKRKAIVLGTTNVPEFLMAYETDNSLYGRTLSPFDPDFTPGGSSGGCAAAVASGCSAASFGSDAGGSVRVPAHFCGLYGLKPTPGSIPRDGHWPPVRGPSQLMATVGPITKTAEDLEYFARWQPTWGSRDLMTYPLGFEDEHWLTDESVLRGSTVGWFDEAWGIPVTEETRAAVRTAARVLEDAGYRVKRIQPRGLDDAPHVWNIFFRFCLRTLIEQITPEGHRLHPSCHDAMATRRQLRETTYEDLLRAWVLRDELRFRLQEQLREARLWLCPVAAIPAFRHGERSWQVGGRTVTYPEAFAYSQVFNVLGVPAATAPVLKTREGLPIGVQLMAWQHCDDHVCIVVKALAAGLGRK